MQLIERNHLLGMQHAKTNLADSHCKRNINKTPDEHENNLLSQNTVDHDQPASEEAG